MKTERLRLISSILYGFFLGFCKPVISLWASWENYALAFIANQSTSYIGYKGKSYSSNLYFSTPLSVSKDQQIKQLELELDQERRMAESLIEDMVNYNKL